MEIELKNYNNLGKNTSIKFESNKINGIIGTDIDEIEKIIKNKYDGKVVIDKKELKKEEFIDYIKKIEILKIDDYLDIQTETIRDLMIYIMNQKKIFPRNVEKKLIDSLRIVGLNKNLLDRHITTISKSETKLLQIAISLLSNPNILIIEEPFEYLDLKNTKNLMIVLGKMKDKYKKIVIFVSNDIEKLYQNTDSILVFNKKGFIIQGQTKEVFIKDEIMKENKIDSPEIIEFTSMAKKSKKVKLDYHKDIRDLIKDIYKHV